MATVAWKGFEGGVLQEEVVSDPVAHICKATAAGLPFQVATVDGVDWPQFAQEHQKALAKAARTAPDRSVLQQQIEGTVAASRGRFKTDLSRTGVVAAVGTPSWDEACKGSHFAAVGNVAVEEMIKIADVRGSDGPPVVGARFWTRQPDIPQAQLSSFLGSFRPSLLSAMHNDTLLDTWNAMVAAPLPVKTQTLIGVFGPQLLETGLRREEISVQLGGVFPDDPAKVRRLLSLVDADSSDFAPGDQVEASLGSWRKSAAGKVEYLWKGMQATSDHSVAEREEVSSRAASAGSDGHVDAPVINLGKLAGELAATENRMHRRRGAGTDGAQPRLL